VGGVGLRVMKNIKGTLIVAHLQTERVVGLRVEHRYPDAPVVLAPEQPNLDPVIRTAVQLVCT
jgi:hypothetical protein